MGERLPCAHLPPPSHARKHMRQHEQDDHEQDRKAGRCGADQPARGFGRVLWRREGSERHAVSRSVM